MPCESAGIKAATPTFEFKRSYNCGYALEDVLCCLMIVDNEHKACPTPDTAHFGRQLMSPYCLRSVIMPVKNYLCHIGHGFSVFWRSAINALSLQ